MRDVAKTGAETGGLPRFLFSLGRWPSRLRDQAAAFIERFRGVTGDELSVSNEVIDKLYRKNGREADRLLAELPDLLRDGEVLPSLQRDDRVLLARPFLMSEGRPTNQVAVIEVARTDDGYEIASIHMRSDHEIAKLRAHAEQQRGEGGSDTGGTATSSFGRSGASTPAAADSPTIGTTSTGSVAPGEVFINWARIDSPEDVKAALQQMADARAGDIDQARRGVRTHADTQAAAAQEDAFNILMQRRAEGGGTPLNAEQSQAVRELWSASGGKLIEVARLAAANPSEANLFAFRKMLATHNLIQREVIAARTETARALESWKIPAGGTTERMRALQEVLERSGGPELHRELAARMAALADNPAAFEAFAERAGKATTMDAVREYWVNALLSSPTTHIVNTTSNAMVAVQQIYERWTAAQIAALRGTAGVAPGEAAAMTHGLIMGFRDALRLGAKALWTGETSMLGKVDVRQRAIRGETFGAEDTTVGRAIDYLGVALNLPARFLGAADEMFKSLGYRMELHAQAVRRGQLLLAATTCITKNGFGHSDS
jgi:hypothetical protein